MGMSKEQYKRITLEELIAKKEQRLAAKKQKNREDFYVESLDGVVTLEEPSQAILRDSANMGDDGDVYVVYQCCVNPYLKSSELAEAYGVAEPPEIVEFLFKPGEISMLAKKCLEMAGYTDTAVTPVKDLKN